MTPAPIHPELHAMVDAACADAMSEADLRALSELLSDSPEAQQVYLKYCRMHVELFFCCGEERLNQTILEDIRAEKAASPATPLPAILAAPVSSATGYLSSGWPVAYLIATVVFVLGLAIGAIIHVSEPMRIAGPSAPLPSPSAADASVVGCITGMVDCQWEGSGFGVQDSAAANQKSEIRNHKSPIHLGDHIALRSGLLELTYDTGARVILQGPVTYEVESPSGGYLSVGKLAARLEQRPEVSGQRSEPANQKSFAVRTPTALVTDLGTEFGVEVQKSGATSTHVFRGSVKLQSMSKSGEAKAGYCVLHENESAQVLLNNDEETAIQTITAVPGTFVRGLPKRIPITLFNTGVGLKEGQPDPHWQITAISNQPNSRPRSALVTKACDGFWMPNDPLRSQWISAVADLSDLPNNVTLTFRTTFDLSGLRPETARLHGMFIADNHTQAIRLNGHNVRVHDHSYDQMDFFHSIEIGNGFIHGVNVLEIDVYNGSPNSPPDEGGPMGLRVELKGSAQQR